MSRNRTYKLLLSTITIFILLACQTPNLPGIPTLIPTFTPAPTQTATVPATVTQTVTATAEPLPTLTPEPAPLTRRVIILSVDGMRPDAISMAPMPNLMALMQQGAYSLSARTIYPSATLPSHSSMLTGLCPSKHGVDWNDYIPSRGYAEGTDLFDVAHSAGFKTYMYVGKKKLEQITEPSSLDKFVFINDRDTVIMDRLLEEFPQDFGVLFIHFAMADGMGHSYGWMSPQYLNVLTHADDALGQLLAELDRLGIRNETLLIVTADHGGHDSTHGSTSPEDMTIPWIAVGPGVQPGALGSPIHTMDTAATAAFALGLSIPGEWDGVPVYEAFGLPVEKPSVECE